MKKFKQILSSFLAASLAFSASITASAEVISSAGEGGSNAVYTETFGAEGAVNNFVTNYNETYKTKTSIEGYRKDDGDYAGKISAVLQGTSSNYADVRRVFGQNVVEDYFSITYDINFLEYDGSSDNSSVIVKLSTRNNKRGGGSIWGYGTNLFGNGSSADKVKVLSASNDAELDIGKWYKVKHYFDGVAHKETMTVTDPKTDDVITTIERSIHNDFYAIEMFSFSVCQPAQFLMDNVCVNSEAVTISGFEENYTTTDDISFSASLPAGFGVASVYANDEEIGTIVEESSGFYDVVITAGTLPEGEYDIRVDAYYDGSLQSDSASFTVSDELIVISPEPGDSVLDGEVLIAASAPKNLTVYAYVDNIYKTELIPNEEEPGLYSASFDVSEGFSMGKHKVLFVAERSDGSALSAESDFSLNYKVLTKSFSQDFDLLASLSDTITDDTKVGVMSNVGFTFANESGADIAVVPGPSGEEGDVAAHIQMSTDKSLTASAPFIRCKSFTNYNQGITEFEFDIKLNTASNTQIRMTNLFLWDEAILFLVNGGYWAGTSVKATTDWTHIKYITDADMKTISMEINGERAVDNAPYGKRSEYSNTQFDLTPLQLGNVSEGMSRTGFAIDNFSAVNYKVYRGITSVGYILDGIETTLEDTHVPFNAESIVVHVPNGLDSSTIDGNVVLCTDAGEEIELSDISYSPDEKTLTLTPDGKFPTGRNLTVKLMPSLSYEDGTAFGTECSYTFCVEGYPIDTDASFEIDGEKIYTADAITSGSRICADIKAVNTSGSEASVVYVLTLRENSRIISMKAKTVNFSADDTEQNIRLYLDEIDSDGTNYELCLMTLNSYTDSNALADYIKLK